MTIDCRLCNGTGYEPALVFASDNATGSNAPRQPNGLVLCRCLTMLERLNMRFHDTPWPSAISPHPNPRGDL
jgi:hypothetical protein